jgi:hypothetical protein
LLSFCGLDLGAFIGVDIKCGATKVAGAPKLEVRALI